MADLAPILAITLALSTVGCETFLPNTCNNSVAGNPPVTYTGGATAAGVYLSSAWDGELLWFPGGRVYLFETSLDEMPRWITLYDSFSMYGTANGGAVARASPAEAEILAVGPCVVTDASAVPPVYCVEVQNPGCQDFWLLIAAGTGATQPVAP